MRQVWFVTGSSRGFGRALVGAALAAGDLVAATARRPEQLTDRWPSTVTASARSASMSPIEAAVGSAIAAARDHFGRLDVDRQQRRLRERRRRSRPARIKTSARSSRPTSGASTTSRRRRFRCSASRAADLSCSSRRLAAGLADPRHRLLPGGQVRHRWLQPRARGRDRAVRGQGDGRRAERLRDRLGRIFHDRPRRPRGVRRNGRGHEPRMRQNPAGPQAIPSGQPRSSSGSPNAATSPSTCRSACSQPRPRSGSTSNSAATTADGRTSAGPPTLASRTRWSSRPTLGTEPLPG